MNISQFSAFETRRSALNNFPLFLALVITGMAATASAQTTYYWDGNGAATGSGATTLAGNWGGGSASAYWGTLAAGTSATTAASLTSLDTAVFAANDGSGAANNWNAAYIVTLGAAQSVNGLVIAGASVGSGNTGGTLTLAGTGSPGLTIGAGGVTMNGSNGDPALAATIGTITLAADQTWNVNNAHVWSVGAAVAGNATAGNTRLWTMGYLNAFTNSYSGIISNGSGGGELALTLNNTNGSGTGAGTNYISGTANTYSGKTTIVRGVLQIASLQNVGGGASSLGAVTTIGSGTIDIGSGTNTAGLVYNGSVASTSDRVLNLAGSTGTITISSTGAAAANTLTLTSNLTAASGNKTLALRGTNTGANAINGIIGDPDGATKISLTKSDTGRWVLGGANTYSGGTTISGGTLSIGSGGTLGSNVAGNNITINGGNLLLAAATNIGASQTISISSGGIGVGYTPASLPAVTDTTGSTGGIYGINYTGDGAVTSLTSLYNGNWFLGSFTAGTYTGSSLAAGNGSKYRLGGGGGTLTIQNSVLAGANDLLVGGTGGGGVILSNANTFTGKTTLQNGTLSVSSLNKVTGGTASSSLGAPTTTGSGTIDFGSGTNAVTLTYTGAGETSDRILNFAGTTGAVTFTNSGTGNLNFSSAATFTGSGAKAFVLGTSSDVYGGTLGAIIDNGGVATVTKNGLTNSTWELSGSNTYTGLTTINGGVISTTGTVLAASARINLNGGGATTMAVLQGAGTITRQLGAGASRLDWGANSGFAAKGGTLTLNLMNNTGTAGGQLSWGTGSFIGTGTAPMVFGSATSDSQVVLQNAVNLNTTDAFNRVIYVEKGAGGDSALISGIISQGVAVGSNNGIVKDGKGTLILSGANTYGNLTTVRAGTLVAGASSLSGSAGAFGLGTGTTAAPTAPSAIMLGDGGTGSVSNNPSLLIGGAFTVSRAVSVTDSGTGNAYSLGGSTDSSATFAGTITVANGSANNNTFSLTQVATTGGNALNITGGITGAANVNTKTVAFNNVGAVNVSTTAISDGAGGGKVAVTKGNSGTVTLSVANTYTGATTVSAGTLLVSGSGTINTSSGVTITGGVLDYQNNTTGLNRNLTINGGTFKNNSSQNYTGSLTFTSGTVGGTNLAGVALTIGSGQTLSPGNSPGTLVAGAQTWASGGNYNWQIVDAAAAPGTGYDTISLTSGSVLDITATSGSQFNINLWSLSSIGPDVNGNATNFNNASTYSWTLVSTDQAIVGFSADKFVINVGAANGTSGFSNALGGGGFSVGLGDGGTDLMLNYSAIPEPSTWILLGLGLTAVATIRNRSGARRSSRV